MTTNERFSSDKYATKGVSERVPLDTQLALWSILDKRKQRGDTLDCLQVFDLTIELVDGEPLQVVRNRQEQPPHEETIYLDVTEPVEGITLWVIDSGEYCTMLFPNEY